MDKLQDKKRGGELSLRLDFLSFLCGCLMLHLKGQNFGSSEFWIWVLVLVASVIFLCKLYCHGSVVEGTLRFC